MPQFLSIFSSLFSNEPMKKKVYADFRKDQVAGVALSSCVERAILSIAAHNLDPNFLDELLPPDSTITLELNASKSLLEFINVLAQFLAKHPKRFASLTINVTNQENLQISDDQIKLFREAARKGADFTSNLFSNDFLYTEDSSFIAKKLR